MRKNEGMKGFLFWAGLCLCTLAAAQPIKIGVLAPLTGPQDWWGQPYRDSVILAYEELGLKPDEVQLVFEDWQSDWGRLALAVQKLVNVDKVDAVINTFDKAAYVCAPILKRAGVPQLVLALDDRPADGQTTFCVWTPVEVTARLMLEEAARKGYKKLALFVLKDYALMRGEIEIKKQIANYPGMEIIDVQHFDPSLREFRMVSLKAREKEWDLGVVLAYPPTATLLTRQLVSDGVKNLTSIEGFDQLEADMGMLPEGTWWSGAADHRVEFDAAFEKRFGYKPFTGPCYGYDCLKLLVAAFEKDRANPAAGLKQVEVMGAGSRVSLTENGHCRMSAYLKRWEGGKKVLGEEVRE